MIKFNTYVTEADNMASRQEELIAELKKLGYEKIEAKTRKKLHVFVPKSDRPMELSNIASKLARFGAEHDKSSKGKEIGGSLGAILFNTAPFEGLSVAVKPSTEKSLTTDEQESLAAYYIALKLKNPNTDYTIDDFKNLPVQSKFSADYLVDKASKGWLVSSHFVAERIYKTFKGKDFTVCQRSKSPFVTNISDKAAELIKKAGKSIGLDKWNPADIWMVHPSLLTTNFDQFESIYDLNTWIQTMYIKKKLVGVSLKQTDKNVKAEIKNFRAVQKPIKLDNINLGKQALDKSIDANVNFNGTNSLIIRSFKPLVDVSGELKGRLAAGGKVGTGPMIEIIKECAGGTFKLTRKTEVMSKYKTNKKALYDYLVKTAKKVDSSFRMTGDQLMQSVESGKYKDSPEAYLVSKIQAAEIAAVLATASKDDVECTLGKMVAYAGSTTDISSVFVKVS